MDGFSHAVPNSTANMAHRDAGGGAVHSISSGHDDVRCWKETIVVILC